jgi:anti-sigma factor RsiW
MNDMHDRLEVMIGRLLDGELSPKERCLLESELQQDRQAKELYEQMRVLHECSCGVVTHEVLGRGADPAEVFERAWQQSKRSFWRRVAKGGLERKGWRLGTRADGHLRFAVGVAAGLLLGLVLRFVPLPHSQIPSNLTSSSQPRVAVDVPPGRYSPVEVTPVRQSAGPRRITREVDWYVYTDRDGNQWLIEGTQEGKVRPAAYPDGL